MFGFVQRKKPNFTNGCGKPLDIRSRRQPPSCSLQWSNGSGNRVNFPGQVAAGEWFKRTWQGRDRSRQCVFICEQHGRYDILSVHALCSSRKQNANTQLPWPCPDFLLKSLCLQIQTFSRQSATVLETRPSCYRC